MLKITLVLSMSAVMMWGSIIPKFGGESDHVDANFVRDDVKKVVIDTKNKKIYNDDSYASKLTYHEAEAYCKKMNYLEKDDWRVPTYEELKSLLELSRRPIAIKHVFQNVQEGIYWSSTKDKYESAWYVDYDLGRYYTSKYNYKYYVLCVRDDK